MSVLVRDTNQIQPIREGRHAAVCAGVFDVGVQYIEKWGKASRRVVITWELPGELALYRNASGDQVERRRTISLQYGLSLDTRSNLRHDLEDWRGLPFSDDEAKGFDLGKIVGVACLLDVRQNPKGGKTYSNVTGVHPFPPGQPRPKLEGSPIVFSVDECPRDQKNGGLILPRFLPNWIGALVRNSAEYQEALGSNRPPSRAELGRGENRTHEASEDEGENFDHLPF